MHKKIKQTSDGDGASSSSLADSNGESVAIRKLLRDIETLGSSNMPWKERKELENRRVVSLGGKPPKKHRVPLSVARHTMKKQKEREQKKLEENLVLGRFGKKSSGSSSTAVRKRKAEDRVLKSSEGYFSRGVLNVRHMLQSNRDNDFSTHGTSKGKMKKGGKKKGKGKKKGGQRRRR